MRMLVVFLDRTHPASRKAKPACRKNTTQLLMRTKKVSTVFLISCSWSSNTGAEVVVGDGVEVDIRVVELVTIWVEVDGRIVVRFGLEAEERILVRIFSVVEVISVRFAMTSVDILYSSEVKNSSII